MLRKRAAQTAFAAVLSLLLSSCVSVSAPSAEIAYESCEQVRSDFASGVAAESADIDYLIIRPVKSEDGYQAARSLDTDGDGVACEYPNPAKAEGQAEPGDWDPKPENFNFRYSNALLQRRGDTEEQWTTEAGTPIEGMQIRRSAYEAIRSLESDSKPSLNWIIGDSVPSDMRKAYLLEVDMVLERLPFPELKAPIDLMIFTEKDVELMSSYWKAMQNGQESIDRLTEAVSVFDFDGVPMWSVGGGAGAREPKNGDWPRLGVDFFMATRHTVETALLADHVAHEIFHVWQYAAVGEDIQIAAKSGYDIADYLPCHAMEGAATTIGTALLMPHFEWYSDNADVISRRISRENAIVGLTSQDAINLLRKGESWESCSEAYAIGMLAHEWLIGKYGIADFLEIYRLAGQRIPYSDALMQLYGFDSETFYGLVSDYIAFEFNRAIDIWG